MKLCDRCFHNGDYKASTAVIIIGIEEFDVCQSCLDHITKIVKEPAKKIDKSIGNDKKKRGRPKTS